MRPVMENVIHEINHIQFRSEVRSGFGTDRSQDYEENEKKTSTEK